MAHTTEQAMEQVDVIDGHSPADEGNSRREELKERLGEHRLGNLVPACNQVTFRNQNHKSAQHRREDGTPTCPSDIGVTMPTTRGSVAVPAKRSGGSVPANRRTKVSRVRTTAVPAPPPVVPAPVPASGMSGIKLSMHLWNDVPARRFVVLNGQRMAEGERVGDLLLVEILRDGVVVERDGQRARINLP